MATMTVKSATKADFKRHAVARGLAMIDTIRNKTTVEIAARIAELGLRADSDGWRRDECRATSFGLERRKPDGRWSRLDLGSDTKVYRDESGFWFVAYESAGQSNTIIYA